MDATIDGMRSSSLVAALVLVGLTAACRDSDSAASVVGAAGDVRASSPDSAPTTEAAATAPAGSPPGGDDPSPVAETNAPDGGAASPTASDPTTATSSPVVVTGLPAVDEPVLQHPVSMLEGSITDPSRDRVVPYVAYVPTDLGGDVPLVLVSHGGTGHPLGHLSAPHLGTTFAAGGFVAIHVGHLASDQPGGQLSDRPADITFVLDQLEAGAIELPASFTGTVDLTRVGHAGHSFGAYTSHAVGGATYASTSGTYRDERIDAIAPISPQGPDQMGGFDRGADDNTWATVTIPSYNLIGGAEVDSNAVDTIERPGWRLVPFDRYPGTSDAFRSIVADQSHSDMWRTGSPEVQQFVAGEILEFMRVFVALDASADPCDIGVGALATVSLERRPAAVDSLIAACA